MAAEYEVLEWKHQRLEPQNQCMHKRKRIHDVKSHGSQSPGISCDDRVMIIGIGIGDTTAPGRHVINSAFVHWLESYEQSTGTSHLLRINELLPAAELTAAM